MNVAVAQRKADMTFWFWVVVRIIANPLSNVFQKLLVREQATAIFVVGATYGLLSVPCMGIFVTCPLPAAFDFWLNMVIATILAMAANVLIVQALAVSDLSLIGPVNAYKSIVSLVPGWLILRETPTPMACSGIALIVAGSHLIAYKFPGARRSLFDGFFGDRGVQFRLAALVLSATEAIFLKRALIVASPILTFAVWAVAGFVLFIITAPVCGGRREAVAQGRILQQLWPSFLALAATTGLMQLSTLIVLQGFQVAAALALFQTSALLTVLLGWKVFRERHFQKRFLGALVMVAGAVLIVLS